MDMTYLLYSWFWQCILVVRIVQNIHCFKLDFSVKFWAILSEASSMDLLMLEHGNMVGTSRYRWVNCKLVFEFERIKFWAGTLENFGETFTCRWVKAGSLEKELPIRLG
jgi:hypothetical protein